MLVDSQSCGIHCCSFHHARLYQWVIDTVSHCIHYDRHGQYECQHVISTLKQFLFSTNLLYALSYNVCSCNVVFRSIPVDKKMELMRELEYDRMIR